ncbi:hypothetical protein MJO29_012929 [Puccinia striiformis f. sp. tritici]|uniref:hypothetical protein n=1 Tax=Puccinia striiformis f. sp. tritici TaxID=168172 RepID=UPI000A127AE8|nr:hypothetical protein Pst134EA_024372 [Puccinia striiformis f. sp. tritici]KAH9453505.1 hypothetical protein Pst134EA_024372 [Puccinia striiformis f. sp. tritici]KAI7943085.1 hypothetical protein MJO29_012929 [Puccinia striiformis f. sp. tritici]KAI9606840.1 hypothetical protein H4Q26_006379 [Puccinia striiformis f. sp. tritici PST-130]KAI9614532.1 hypothetical protein KEM48_005998 [Puccinia striiformis f. sp. tritici PST-130]
MSRPEHQAPPEIFYNDNEAEKYTKSSRIQSIQSEMTERCLELLNLPSQSNDSQEDYSGLILDIGCGSGLSGEIISEYGHQWVGADISGSMLEIALDREVEGDLCLHDIGQGFGFRAGSFDGAISVSVIQWLCNADKSCNSPPKRLKAFFETLFGALVRGARAVFQFYPESDDQVRFIMSFANRAGFTGGLVVDYPNSQKAKKFYLVLMTGPSPHSTNSTNNNGNQLPQGLTTEDSNRVVKYSKKSNKKLNKRKSGTKNRVNVDDSKQAWIYKKKELYRNRGKEDVPRDSKFTGRKRKTQF